MDKLAPEGQRASVAKQSLVSLAAENQLKASSRVLAEPNSGKSQTNPSQYTFDSNGISKSVQQIYGGGSKRSSTKGLFS